jgi:putative tryptophan/tyrosine transport system substrate-binding protein
MDRRRFLLTSVAGALAAPLGAGGQQAGKVYRIGYLGAGGPAPLNTPIAFEDALRELGYVAGKNLLIDYRFAEGRYERLPALAAELVRLKADIIVTNPTPATVAAKKATETIPIVMISGSVDPVGLGLVASLARPGGNVTGLSFGASTEIFSKGLELLKDIVPKVRRVAVLSNPGSPIQPLIIRELNAAGRSLGVQLQLLEVRGLDEFDDAFAAMAKERVGALLVVSDSLFNIHRARLADLAARSRLPAAYGTRDLVEVGGLMSYGPSFRDLFRRGAVYVDKILKGAKPADLPVEQPTKFELVINLKTAKALGLTIPPSLLARADQVIE